MIRLELEYSLGFSWYRENGVFAKGYFHDEEGYCHERANIARYFQNTDSLFFSDDKLRSLNGLYSIIIIKDNKILIHSDKSRFFTLFYAIGDDIVISDSVNKLIEVTGKQEIDPLSEIEFKAMGHVLGNRTLIKGIYQVQAGERIILDSQGIVDSKNLFSYKTDSFLDLDFEDMVIKAKDCIQSGFDRMYSSIKGKQIVVPLSGGYDSRLIATFLRDSGAKDVICMTYGVPSHADVGISRKVAKNLGYKWHFMDHSKIAPIDPDKDHLFMEYMAYASQYSSMFFLTEFFITKYLKEEIGLGEDTVFLPGHSGDLVGGSQYIKAYHDNLNYKNLIDTFIRKKSVIQKMSKGDELQIGTFLKHTLDLYADQQEGIDARTFFEDLDIKEKISKFIINSSKVFPFFGFEVRMPYWDKEIMGFFGKIPFSMRKGKYLYDHVLEDYWFKKMNVCFKSDLKVNLEKIKKQRIKDSLKKFVPKKYKFKYVLKSDWGNYFHLTEIMRMDMERSGEKYERFPNSVNGFLTQWYLMHIKKAGLK